MKHLEPTDFPNAIELHLAIAGARTNRKETVGELSDGKDEVVHAAVSGIRTEFTDFMGNMSARDLVHSRADEIAPAIERNKSDVEFQHGFSAVLKKAKSEIDPNASIAEICQQRPKMIDAVVAYILQSAPEVFDEDDRNAIAGMTYGRVTKKIRQNWQTKAA